MNNTIDYMKIEAQGSVLASLRAALNERSHDTALHAERMSILSRRFGSALHLDEKQINELELLSTLHDIGKVNIDSKILNKPGKLSDDEWMEMKKHPAAGYRIAMTSSDLRPVAEYILGHHERWDGKGYPLGLAGETIPLLSRVISVVDAYDAMSEDRPYRKALAKESAFTEIRKNAGTQFDPVIAALFAKFMTDANETIEASDAAMTVKPSSREGKSGVTEHTRFAEAVISEFCGAVR